MNKLSIPIAGCVGLLLSGLPVQAESGNLLKNFSFETIDPTAGGVARHPAGWTVEGTANRCNWRKVGEGRFCIGVCGLWAEIGSDGSVSQSNIEVEEGQEYLLRPWLYADHDWRPRKQYLRMEFYHSEDPEKVLHSAEHRIRGVFPSFSAKEQLTAVAPSGANRARITIGVDGVSFRGGLSIDAVYFGRTADAPPLPETPTPTPISPDDPAAAQE